MEKETVMEKCPTDIRALKNLKDAFDVFFNDAIKNACKAGKDSRVKDDIAEMKGVCRNMCDRLDIILESIPV